jgi:uncharacterized protein YbjT (DUF2867 family)
MRVLVTGGYGLIGSAVLARLNREGHVLVGAGRAIEEASRRFAYARWIAADFMRLSNAAAWQPLLAGIDAVVNCVGVLQDSGRDRTRQIHVDATMALFEACRAAGIRRVVHVSAIGSQPDGTTAFSRSKADAEAGLAGLDLDWVILRPALVLAPAVYGGSAMLRGLAGMPLVTPVIGGDNQIQIVSLEDVTETIAFCLRPHAPGRVRWELAHPQVVTLTGIVVATRRWLGFPPRPVIQLPRFMAAIVSHLADALSWLGWRSPVRSTALAALSSGIVGDPKPWMAATRIQPKSLDEILAASAATVQDRWFARLYPLKAPAIAALALLWIAPALLQLTSALDMGLANLVRGGVPNIALLLQVLLSLAVGLGVLVRPLARTALAGMIGVAILPAFAWPTIAGDPWLAPILTLVSVVASALPPLFVLAILDER